MRQYLRKKTKSFPPKTISNLDHFPSCFIEFCCSLKKQVSWILTPFVCLIHFSNTLIATIEPHWMSTFLLPALSSESLVIPPHPTWYQTTISQQLENKHLSIRKSTHISFTSMPQLISTTFWSIQFQKTYHRQCNALQSLTLKENVTKIHWLASNIRVIIQNLYTITTGYSIRFLKLQLETRV